MNWDWSKLTDDHPKWKLDNLRRFIGLRDENDRQALLFTYLRECPICGKELGEHLFTIDTASVNIYQCPNTVTV
jgi:hypothetical protein